jgi:hypothetical protein
MEDSVQVMDAQGVIPAWLCCVIGRFRNTLNSLLGLPDSNRTGKLRLDSFTHLLAFPTALHSIDTWACARKCPSLQPLGSCAVTARRSNMR